MSLVDGGRLAAPRSGRRILLAAAASSLIVFLAVGLLGAFRYLRGFWLYRGFPPPHDPAYVHSKGTSEHFMVKSAALAGRSQPVYVYLPPGYDSNAQQRYPVFYLLHGFPGSPQGAFLMTGQMGVLEDEMIARHQAPPVILVMPYGSTGYFNDKEWANGVGRGQGWETFVARDVVRAVDARYRTVRAASARAIGGLSSGGYGALNIGLHHPGEFRVIESWSGYERADHLKSIFGGSRRLFDYNSPLHSLAGVAGALRRAQAFFWFYSGARDPLHKQNDRFARELSRTGIPHVYLLLHGGHDWGLWRANAGKALFVAAKRLGNG